MLIRGEGVEIQMLPLGQTVTVQRLNYLNNLFQVITHLSNKM